MKSFLAVSIALCFTAPASAGAGDGEPYGQFALALTIFYWGCPAVITLFWVVLFFFGLRSLERRFPEPPKPKAPKPP